MPKLMLPVVGATVLLILAAAAYVMLRPAPVYLSKAMINVEGSDIGGPFELTAHTGERMSSETPIHRPTLIYFGYTFCPDICPIDSQTMADAVDILADDGIQVRPVFVTVDPERDTPEELSHYAEALHPEMIALTGSLDEIKAAATAYRVYYNRVNMPGSAAGYLMEHTGFMYLMTPGKGLTALFRNGFPPEQIAVDIKEVLGTL